ncbi:type I restriction endonuclease subunit R [Mycoplasmopsis arginini]|uniref:type I restriction endonuclease subunit R n=1 Tax=Mycoplasmopsis arginini TaxID=2094 RepID=UPI00249D9CB6|nr:type I restriction endonuclease subunit R [Mycoplasmopsis arginini]MDI3348347.1 Type I restriction enzyme EcoR124II R protein [Mycoplasmopsis arginini]
METKVLAYNDNSTVVAEFIKGNNNSIYFESEASLEEQFIKKLVSQGYEYLKIKDKNSLMINLRHQIEKLNDFQFSESEWKRFLDLYLLKENNSLEDYSDIIQNNYIYTLKLDDNKGDKNIKIIDKTNIHKNFLQVINQYEVTNQDNVKNRYDVTILVNGLPLIHIELKRRGVDLREAFNQIERYKNKTMFEKDSLFLFTQIYVISNGSYTKYYSNTTRETSIKARINQNIKTRKTSNSFKFTIHWTDSKNNRINDLLDFTQTFFARHTILNILTKYCVLTTDKTLLILRPYQIVATEKIINKINVSLSSPSKLGTTAAGGFIWHTTGSGKTLTSFKTSMLAKEIPNVDKVFFVVDRKDLDYQTIKEYERYSKGCVVSSSNSNQLKDNIENDQQKIIITTIQKLNIFIKNNKKNSHPIFNKNVVLIFDECHRSQFGVFQTNISQKFKNYMLFGFTGTPIFEENSLAKNNFNDKKTTKEVFGECLHTYTIEKAVKDGSVLPFRIEYVNTIKGKNDIEDEKVSGILKLEVLENKERISKIVKWILENFDRLTRRNRDYIRFNKTVNIPDLPKSNVFQPIKEKKTESVLNGFNSILACSSIKAAKIYYNEFKKQQENLPENEKLRIGLIYSFAPNEDITENYNYLEEENNESINGLDQSSRDFLEEAIADYNKMFNVNYSANNESFNNFYKDFSLRLKNRELDIAIVVNMFLTGFDSTTLNTLWLDKRLIYHGLLQAMSRTNRILNEVKSNGNVVCFSTNEDSVNRTIQLFTDEDKLNNVIICRNFSDYYNGFKDDDGRVYNGYTYFVERLKEIFPNDDYDRFLNEEEEHSFIKIFNEILKARNILMQFDEFKNKDILSDYQIQNYQSTYLELEHKYRTRKNQKSESILKDLVFETELIKSVDIDINYILDLIGKAMINNNKVINNNIDTIVSSSPNLRSKKELIKQFLNKVNSKISGDNSINVYTYWDEFNLKEKQENLKRIIDELNLDEEKTKKFIDQQFKNGFFNDSGTAIPSLMKTKFSLFNNTREQKIVELTDKLKEFFYKFLN